MDVNSSKQDESSATTDGAAPLSSSSNNQHAKQNEPATSLCCIVQRFRKASLLVEETHMVTVGGTDSNSAGGILAYVSFGSTCNRSNVLQLARTLLNLPILTSGLWGDGSEPISVLDMATQKNGGVAVMLVPQANLISKVKSLGRSIQYHGQCDKTMGEELFEYLVNCVKAIALEHQLRHENADIPKWLTDLLDNNRREVVDPSVPPTNMFRNVSLYSSWDDQGIPLTHASSGEPLSKSARKKLNKQYESHTKRHAKYLLQTSTSTSSSTRTTSDQQEKVSWDLLKDDFIRVVAGSFGKRQGIEMVSDMGPFCHVLNL